MYQNNHTLIRRLKIIENQIRDLQEMILKKTYCVDFVAKTSSVKQMVSGVEDALLENYLSHLVLDQAESGEKTKMVMEILKICRLKRR
jgi:DNA-binding FrmR family transcriptional regulator